MERKLNSIERGILKQSTTIKRKQSVNVAGFSLLKTSLNWLPSDKKEKKKKFHHIVSHAFIVKCYCLNICSV